MRIKIIRTELDDEQMVDIKDFQELVNEAAVDLEAKGFKVKDIMVDRFRNKLTAIIKYRKPIWWIL